ncbi:MAG: dTDP-4-keto-6-deoxy-D-glucose epimerase [Pseudomonas sp.]|nr:MAG: dTDP-4-keto-6-deoxy-D-glucose epimerase [Pseudomonas sp.]
MRFTSLAGSDAKLIDLQVHGDKRGFFARTWCADLFHEAGLNFEPVQGNMSMTKARGAIRGMHFQRDPQADAKVVRCSFGRIYDVIVDLRVHSNTRGEAFQVELDGEGAQMLFIPEGFAHGFQTLTDNVIVEYLMGAPYVPSLYDGARFDDPLLAIQWPEPVGEVSENDRRWPNLADRMPWLKHSVMPC